MRLLVVGGPARPGPFELKQGPNVIGRDPDSTIRLNDVAVSRKHAVAFLRGKMLAVADQSSANGILDLAGNKVDRMDLRHGDEVLIGPFVLRFDDPDAQMMGELTLDEDTASPPTIQPANVTAQPVMPQRAQVGERPKPPSNPPLVAKRAPELPMVAPTTPGLPGLPGIGDVLDHRYRIKHAIGSGGFSTVFLVEHVVLGSEHAIKVLHPHLAKDREMQGRFLAEGRIQARLRHPNVVAVTDIVTHPVAGLVLDYVNGPTLDDHLQELGRPLWPSEIAALLIPIIDAVACAHAAGVIHRDLKPENIILAKRGNTIVPTLTDFGIAKLAVGNDIAGQKQKTRTGMRIGTLRYMSPEQIQSAADLDSRADIFSLGAILYELACGVPAFPDDNDWEAMKRIVDGKYERPLAVNPQMSRPLQRCIDNALEPRRDRRTATCADLRAELLHALRARRSGASDAAIVGVAVIEQLSGLEFPDNELSADGVLGLALRRTSLTPRELVDEGFAVIGDKLLHVPSRSRATGRTAFDGDVLIELAGPNRRGFRWRSGGGAFEWDGQLAAANGLLRAVYRANGATFSGNANQALVFVTGPNKGRSLDELYIELANRSAS